MRTALEGIEGIADLKKELHMETPQVEIEVDLAKAQQYGLKPGDVRRAAAFLLQGEEVGDIFIGGKTYDVNVWSTPETRHSLTDIQNLLIDTPDGGQVRLADVADIRIMPVPNVIEREGQSRKIDVSANVKGRDLGSVAGDAPAPVDPAGTVTIQAGVVRRGVLAFDLSFLSRGTVINSAELQVNRLPAPPFVSRTTDSTLIAHLATGTDLTTFESSDLALKPVAGSATTLAGDIRHIAQSWVSGVNYGLVFTAFGVAGVIGSGDDVAVRRIQRGLACQPDAFSQFGRIVSREIAHAQRSQPHCLRKFGSVPEKRRQRRQQVERLYEFAIPRQ